MHDYVFKEEKQMGFPKTVLILSSLGSCPGTGHSGTLKVRVRSLNKPGLNAKEYDLIQLTVINLKLFMTSEVTLCSSDSRVVGRLTEVGQASGSQLGFSLVRSRVFVSEVSGLGFVSKTTV